MPRAEKIHLLGAGLLPLAIFAAMMAPFVNGCTSLVESSAIGALAALVAAIVMAFSGIALWLPENVYGN